MIPQADVCIHTSEEQFPGATVQQQCINVSASLSWANKQGCNVYKVIN